MGTRDPEQTKAELGERQKWREGFEKDASEYLEEVQKSASAAALPKGFGLYRDFAGAVHSEFFLQGVRERTWVVAPDAQKKTINAAMDEWHNKREIEGKGTRFAVVRKGSMGAGEHHVVTVLNIPWKRGVAVRDAVPVIVLHSEPTEAAILAARNSTPPRPEPEEYVALVIPCVTILPKHTGAGVVNPGNMTAAAFQTMYGGSVKKLLDNGVHLTPRFDEGRSLEHLGGDWMGDVGTKVHKDLAAFFDHTTIAITIQLFVQGTSSTNNEYRLPTYDLRLALSGAMREFSRARRRDWLAPDASKALTVGGCNFRVYAPVADDYSKVPFMLMHEEDSRHMRLVFPCRMRLPLHAGRARDPGQIGVARGQLVHFLDQPDVVGLDYIENLLETLSVHALPPEKRSAEERLSMAEIQRLFSTDKVAAIRYLISLGIDTTKAGFIKIKDAWVSLAAWLDAHPWAARLLYLFLAGGVTVAALNEFGVAFAKDPVEGIQYMAEQAVANPIAGLNATDLPPVQDLVANVTSELGIGAGVGEAANATAFQEIVTAVSNMTTQAGNTTWLPPQIPFAPDFVQ